MTKETTRKDILMLLAFLIIGVFVIAGLYLVLSGGLPEREYFSKKQAEEIVPPLATGNIDDVVDALLKELLDEEALLVEEERDVGLVTSDNKEINNLGQSVNENEL